MLAQDDPNDPLSGAAPYLELFGVAAGGFYLGRLAIVAASESDDPWLDAKIDTAVFYATNILPTSSGLGAAAMAGAPALFAVDTAHLGAK
jgi:hypothetical protein